MKSKSRPFFLASTLIAAVLFAWTVQHVFGTFPLFRSDVPQVRDLALAQLGIEAVELFLCSVVMFFSIRQLLGKRPTRSESELSRRLREQDLDMGPSLRS